MSGLDFADPSLLNRAAWAARWRDRNESVRLARSVLDRRPAESDTDVRNAGLALRTLAWQSKWRGDLDTAHDQGERALEFLEEADAAGAADVDSILGVVQYSRGRHDLARAAVDRGFERLKSRPSIEARIDLLATESTILRYLGRIGMSFEALEQALALAEGAGLARIQHNFARLRLAVGDLEGAFASAVASVAAARRWGNVVVLPYALEVCGTVHVRRGRSERARLCFDEGLEIARRDEDRRAECQIIQQIGALALDDGRSDDAIEALKRGCSLARGMNYPLWEQNLYRDLARAHEAMGDIERALEAMKTLNGLRERQTA